VVIQKFFELSLDILKRGRNDVVEAYCAAMKKMDPMSRLTILYRQRRKIFGDHEGVVQLLENFTKEATTREGPGMEDFLEEFRKHMGAEGDGRGKKKPNARRILSQMIESPVGGGL
jgi:hypothetical protein